MPSGVTDVCIHTPDGIELVEAKSGTTQQHVRQALAQLLDYAPHLEGVHRLVALFPGALLPGLAAYLHTYGIDVVYESDHESGQFLTDPAAIGPLDAIKSLWGPTYDA